MTVIILSISFRYGVFGILIGQIIESVLAYIPNSYFSAKLIDYNVREQMADFFPCLGISVAVSLLIWGADHFLPWGAFIKLMTLGPVSAILYISSSHLIKLNAYCMARQMILDRKSKQRMN
jgi:hypothetical protein